jgi:hypothetical protein
MGGEETTIAPAVALLNTFVLQSLLVTRNTIRPLAFSIYVRVSLWRPRAMAL